MLVNVLGDYLDNVKEREFDLPLATLLRASGFDDVHFTHGTGEYGKDFIAKRKEEGVVVQYTFQSKAGDLSQADWRNNVMGQMLESVILGLSHPNFDKDAPHQAVLIITGRLSNNAALGIQDFNKQIVDTYRKRPVSLWDREILINELEKNGLGGVYQATASGFVGYGRFYEQYGKALGGFASQREIEEHSRHWLDESIQTSRGLLCSAIEAKVLASQCRARGMLYEAASSLLTVIRTILHHEHKAGSNTNNPLVEVYHQAAIDLRGVCDEYLADFQGRWVAAGRNLSSLISGCNPILTYSIHCARTMEVAGCAYFLHSNETEKQRASLFLRDFVTQESGCGRVPSDYYAVSLVLPILSLCRAGYRDAAVSLVERTAVWLCDRYEDGYGLADISANPYEEIALLFGYPFEFFRSQRRKASFAAAVVCDLAAYIGNKSLYADVVNDITAAGIVPQYWQVPDTASLFTLEGKDIVCYPNIEYSYVHLPFSEFSFAEHIRQEPRSFTAVQHTGPIALFLMMLLLRDRYFPTQWPLLS